MPHPLDEYEPTPEDVAGVLSKALAEKAQTIRDELLAKLDAAIGKGEAT